MSRLFGWDLPPGCSMRDIENAMGGEEPSLESERVYEALEPYGVPQEKMDEIANLVDELVTERNRLAEYLAEDRQRLSLLLRAGKLWADFYEEDSLIDQKTDPQLAANAKAAEEQLLEIINQGGY